MALWLRLPFWFVHSLASFVWWTGRCCLYPQGSRDYKASNKVRESTHCKTSRSWDWNLPVACRCIACLRDYSDTHHGGTDGLIRARRIVTHAVRRGVVGTWSPAFLSMQVITLRRTTDPHILPWGPDLTTLVDSLLHQMHLMPLT